MADLAAAFLFARCQSKIKIPSSQPNPDSITANFPTQFQAFSPADRYARYLYNRASEISVGSGALRPLLTF
jgi:hypothetical protein